MRSALHSLFVLAFVLWPLAANPEALSTGFEAANKLYEEGKYADAAASYERLLQGGQVSAALYFNLGNAAFKSSQIGRAIAAYRQAERIAPRKPGHPRKPPVRPQPGPGADPGRWALATMAATASPSMSGR